MPMPQPTAAEDRTNMPIALPNEIWMEIFLFINRYLLGLKVAFVNRHFWELAYLPMFVWKPHRGFFLFLDGKRAEEYCLEMNPPTNFLGFYCVTITKDVTPTLVRVLKYFIRHRLLDEVKIYDDGFDGAAQVIPDLANLFPEFFTMEGIYNIMSITNRRRVNQRGRIAGEHKRPRKAFSHPAILGLRTEMLTVVGREHFRAGPLVNWLHWPMDKVSWERRLTISLWSAYNQEFLDHFIWHCEQQFSTAKKCRPFRVKFFTRPEPFPNFPEWTKHNQRTGEMLSIGQVETEDGQDMLTFQMKRCFNSDK